MSPAFDDAVIARHAEMLANRVKKSFKHLHPRFERRGVGAFRLYDHDIPEVRAVVDWYEGHLVCAEYERTQTSGTPWLERVSQAAAAAVGVPAERVHLKRRRTRPADGRRYERLAGKGSRIEVREAPLRFWVNLDDFIDTGLFPDHRETRARVRAESGGKRVLNLFGYTGSFTCAAAAGDAAATVTVDVSARYLEWAGENLELNGLASPRHVLERADAREWLRIARRRRERFDLAILDPPSFSDRGDLDIQRDHRALIDDTLTLLAPAGTLYFSTNHQRFDPHLTPLDAHEITSETLPEDYRHPAHRSWLIRGHSRGA